MILILVGRFVVWPLYKAIAVANNRCLYDSRIYGLAQGRIAHDVTKIVTALILWSGREIKLRDKSTTAFQCFPGEGRQWLSFHALSESHTWCAFVIEHHQFLGGRRCVLLTLRWHPER